MAGHHRRGKDLPTSGLPHSIKRRHPRAITGPGHGRQVQDGQALALAEVGLVAPPKVKRAG